MFSPIKFLIIVQDFLFFAACTLFHNSGFSAVMSAAWLAEVNYFISLRLVRGRDDSKAGDVCWVRRPSYLKRLPLSKLARLQSGSAGSSGKAGRPTKVGEFIPESVSFANGRGDRKKTQGWQRVIWASGPCCLDLDALNELKR